VSPVVDALVIATTPSLAAVIVASPVKLLVLFLYLSKSLVYCHLYILLIYKRFFKKIYQ
jgi:hypothetical protein